MISRRDRPQRHSRRNIYGVGDEFRPTMLSGLVLWVRADMGLTVVNPTVASASNLSTGSWTPNALSGRNATTITEDSSSGFHFVVQAITGLQLRHKAHYRIGVPPSSGNGRYVGISVDSGAPVIMILDTETSSIVSAHANFLNVTYSGGILEFDCTGTIGSNIYILTSNGVTTNYLGNGTRTATLGDNGLGAFITITQHNVSAWADQSGAGHHLTQATASKYMLREAAGGPGGKACVTGDAVDDFLRATWTQNQPEHMFVIAKVNSQTVANATLWDGASGNTMRAWLNGAAPSDSLVASTNAVSLIGGITTPLAWHHYETLYNGASSHLKVDGTTLGVTTDVGAGNGGGLILNIFGDQASAPSNTSFYEVIMYNRALLADESSRIRGYLDRAF